MTGGQAMTDPVEGIVDLGPVRSRDVAAYLIRQHPELRRDTVKLNALLYLSQAWHLAWSDRPLFTDDILAAPGGPYVTGVFRKRISTRGGHAGGAIYRSPRSSWIESSA